MIFVLAPQDGHNNAFVKVDGASATDNSLRVTLPQFRSSKLTVGCEVQVIRDNGGGVRHSKKYKDVSQSIQ